MCVHGPRGGGRRRIFSFLAAGSSFQSLVMILKFSLCAYWVLSHRAPGQNSVYNKVIRFLLAHAVWQVFALKPLGMVGAHELESENTDFILLLRV